MSMIHVLVNKTLILNNIKTLKPTAVLVLFYAPLSVSVTTIYNFLPSPIKHSLPKRELPARPQRGTTNGVTSIQRDSSGGGRTSPDHFIEIGNVNHCGISQRPQ